MGAVGSRVEWGFEGLGLARGQGFVHRFAGGSSVWGLGSWGMGRYSNSFQGVKSFMVTGYWSEGFEGRKEGLVVITYCYTSYTGYTV